MQLESHIIRSRSGEYTRDGWFLPGAAEQDHPLCVFLDAEHYLRDMNSLPVLVELMDRGLIPQVSCLFISHVSGAARHEDYLCNDRYSEFIAEDVVAWARKNHPGIQASGNVICGLSLSGLAGAYIALRYPQVFSFSLCQSGSFWWRMNYLADTFRNFGRTKTRFWMSVGNEETAVGVSHPPTGLYQDVSQIEGVETAAGTLESMGATVRYNLYTGGHAIAPWREELPVALHWLFGAEPAATDRNPCRPVVIS